MIRIKEGKTAAALAALWNNSNGIATAGQSDAVTAIRVFATANGEPMTEEEAQELLDRSDNPYFDYLEGRVMKLGFTDHSFEEALYDRDNGNGAARRALGNLVQETIKP